MQTTFADWLKAQATADLNLVEADLQREADAQQTGLDYRELEHYEDQFRYAVEAADEFAPCPPTVRTPYS